jgi:organic radical activating enzyme
MIRKLIKLVPSSIKKSVHNTLFCRLFILRPLMLSVKPDNLQLELTDKCNLICSYCPKGHGVGLKGGDMDFNLFKKIVDDAEDINIFTLVGYGEPLLYAHIIDAIKYIKDSYPKKKVSLTSNGTLLTKEICKDLINSGLDHFIISVNVASREKYLQYSKSNGYNRLIGNTKLFLEILNEGNIKRNPKTDIQIINTINTDIEIKEFENYWKPYLFPNAKTLIAPYINWGGVVSDYKFGDKDRYPCTQLYRNRVITREGIALPCCSCFPFEVGDMALGNVKEITINDLYSGGIIREIRKANLEGNLQQEFNLCSKCDSWKTVPNIWIKNPLHKIIGRMWY